MAGGPNIPYPHIGFTTDQQQQHRAQLTCADNARSREDLVDLLRVLGLDHR